MGGLLPGLLATVISLVLSFTVFASRQADQSNMMISLIAFAVMWLFISVICDIMRNAALNIHAVSQERDMHRDRLSVILDDISDAFFAIDKEWKVIHANSTLLKMVELTEREMIGKVLWDVIPAERADLVREPLVHSMITRKECAFDIPARTGGRWLQIRCQPNSEGVFIYIQDVTDRKTVEEAKERMLADERKARSDAENASQLKDEFVATLSHELRTPLTTILGWSEILSKRAETFPQFQEGLQAIERSTQLQSQLIDDLLDMSRINAGKLRLQIEVVELSELITDAVQTSRVAAENKNIEIKLDFQRQECFVRGDASRLTQIISNLASNAVKFTKSGGKVTIRLMEDGPNVIVAVQDTGEGIDPEFLPWIFDRFRQANASVTRKHGGLGLGLSIVKQLTELHGGSIEASSPGVGQGSCFTLRLPTVAPPRVHSASYKESQATEQKKRLEGIRILIVEDDDSTRDLLQVMLSEAGATVGTASRAEEALEKFNKFEPMFLLSDIGMPDIDGYELIRRVRKLPNGELPAIALTAFARKEDRDKAIEAGFDEHLTKPIDLQRLLSKIRHLHELVNEPA